MAEPPIRGEKADRMAEERNRKQAEQFPLLAYGGQLEGATGKQIRDAYEARAESRRTLQEELQRRADAFRAQVAALVSTEELAAMEKRLAILPDCPAYRADHGRRMRRKIQSRHDGS